jgi:hypothetical protein
MRIAANLEVTRGASISDRESFFDFACEALCYLCNTQFCLFSKSEAGADSFVPCAGVGVTALASSFSLTFNALC